MKRDLLTSSLLITLVSLLLFAGSAAAETVTGTANTRRDLSYAFVPITSGQALVTLTWKRAAAELFIVMTCGEDGEEQVLWGVGAGFMDRVQRIESGIVEDLPCVISVASSRGSSGFALNLQVTADEPLQRTSGTVLAGGAALVAVDPARWPELEEKVDRIRSLRQAASQ